MEIRRLFFRNSNILTSPNLNSNPNHRQMDTPTKTNNKTSIARGMYNKLTGSSTSLPLVQMESTNNITTTHQIISQGYTQENLTVSANSTCGYLLRNWETLKSWRLLYYIIDFDTNMLLECNDKTLRAKYALHTARLNQLPNQDENNYCFQVIIKSDKENLKELLYNQTDND